MKKILLAVATVMGLLISLVLLSNSPHHKPEATHSKTFQMESLDDPDKDSLINFTDAMVMHQNYMNDQRKFKFRYHDNLPLKPGSVIETNLEGVMFNASTVQDLLNKSKCQKLYLMLGVNYQKRKADPSITDTLLTMLLMPVDGTPGNYTFMKDILVPEYANPCPPYCPR